METDLDGVDIVFVECIHMCIRKQSVWKQRKQDKLG